MPPSTFGVPLKKWWRCQKFKISNNVFKGSLLPPTPLAASCSEVKILINTLRPRHNGRHFADDIFKCSFVNENVWILIKFSLKFVPKGPINYIPALVQIMAWRRLGDKPLFEPMMISLLTHICVTRPRRVKATVIKGKLLVSFSERFLCLTSSIYSDIPIRSYFRLYLCAQL